MTIEHAIEKAENFARDGNLGRAKEVLQGNIGNLDFDPRLYAAYGRVLKQMGDEVQAGKYFFIAGCLDESSKSAIAAYENRYRKAGVALVHNWPSKAKRAGWDKLPPATQERLTSLGVSMPVFTDYASKFEATQSSPKDTFVSILLLFGFLILAGASVSLGWHGIVFLVDWIGGQW